LFAKKAHGLISKILEISPWAYFRVKTVYNFSRIFFKLKVDFEPLDGKVDIGCIIAT
jgi:hypothetical protein